MDMGSLSSRHARYRAEHPALVVGGQCLTWRSLDQAINRLANALLTAGLRKGDKFATVLPNCLEMMLAYWAGAKTGCVIVPLSPLLQDGGLLSLLRDSDTRLVIGHASFADCFSRIREKLPLIAEDGWVLVGDETALPSIARRIEEMDPDLPVTALVAVPAPEDAQTLSTAAALDMRWILRDDPRDGAALRAALAAVDLPDGTFVWIAAEAGVARALRDDLLARGYPAPWIKAAGYWIAGQADAAEKDL